MARLSRTESQAVTRDRLREAARDLFKREGYLTTSVERIADAAGYTKGAVYSNFENKESIFLEVLEAQGQESLNDLFVAIDQAPDTAAIIALLVGWADDRSRSGGWSLTILEHARQAPSGSDSLRRQEEIIRGHWRQLGGRLLARFPHLPADSETLGALLHEIAYAPAMTFIFRPTAGELMRLALTALLSDPAGLGHHASDPRRSQPNRVRKDKP
jgi:TetR/AcrR family transcriptional regulator, transcriptional repressor of aconitase